MGIFDWFKKEDRSAYTDVQVEIARQLAIGESVVISGQTAIQELVAGHWGRAFALAEVSPENTVTNSLTPSILQMIGRELVLHGEVVFEIVMDNGIVSLLPVQSYNITGGGMYELTISDPNRVITRFRSPEAVVHLRYGEGVARPWQGQSPLQSGSTSMALANNVELKLAQETSGPVGNVVPTPDVGNSLTALQTDIKNLKGQNALVPTTSGGWDSGAVNAPRTDWKPQRIGANPPDSLVKLRSDVIQTVAASAGIPAQLIDNTSEGTSLREAFRQFLHSTIVPVGVIISGELQHKFDEPGLSFRFDKLFAADIMGRARAFGTLVGAGVSEEEAARVTGLQ